MSTVKPLGNRVLVKRAKAQTTKGGIILPDTAQEKPKEGKVVAVGPGGIDENGHREAMNVKVGDRVLFSSYSGTEVKSANTAEDEELLILSESEIFGIIA